MVKMSKRQITAKARKIATLGSALDEGGFKSLGHRIRLKVGIDQSPLRRPQKTLGTAQRQD